MKEKPITTFFGSEDKYITRKAEVSTDDIHFIVRLYEKQNIVWTELVSDKSIHWAEDIAENWVMGVGKFKDGICTNTNAE